MLIGPSIVPEWMGEVGFGLNDDQYRRVVRSAVRGLYALVFVKYYPGTWPKTKTAKDKDGNLVEETEIVQETVLDRWPLYISARNLLYQDFSIVLNGKGYMLEMERMRATIAALAAGKPVQAPGTRV